LSKDWIINTLRNLGFSENDARVYLQLLIHGPQDERIISETLRMHQATLQKVMINLKNNRLVITSKHPPLFWAEPLEKVLDFLTQERMKQKQFFEKKREELVSIWQSITKKSYFQTSKP
jgi:sugar-specific transcriptional regulator TrmB